MRIVYIIHEQHEGPGNIDIWAKSKNFRTESIKMYLRDKLPSLQDFDWLVIMGGSMNVYETSKYPWLVEEKQFIKQAIESNKVVVGVCLGAQLIAEILGAQVKRNKYKEIGWFEVCIVTKTQALTHIPDKFTAFHWHGDTFDIPTGAIRLMESEACENQAFEANSGLVLGLQFHIETDLQSVDNMLLNDSNELEPDKYVQTERLINAGKANIRNIKGILFRLLDNMLKTANQEVILERKNMEIL